MSQTQKTEPKNRKAEPKEQKVEPKTQKTEAKNDKKGKNTKQQKNPKIQKTQLLIAILLALYEILNVILFIICELKKPKENIQGVPLDEFNEQDSFLKMYHWIFHSIIIIYIIFLSSYAFKDYINGHQMLISLGTAFTTLFSFIIWVSYIGIVFVITADVKNLIKIDDLKKLLEGPPTKLAFFYSKDMIQSHNLTRNPTNGQMVDSKTLLKCYSNAGITLPLISELIGERYDFTNTPEFFYFKIDQLFDQTNEFQLEFNKTIKKIKHCSKSGMRIKFYPILNKTFAVGNPGFPQYLTHKNRMLTGFLGFGFYYDSYARSFPYIRYHQNVKVDIDPDFNYTKLWTTKWCKSFGKCDPLNRKPLPDDEL